MAAQVTMRQVADLAGVSAKTVSNVMRGTGGASQATRERVLAAVRELGYRVNPRAAALRSGRHGAIALAVPTLQQPTYALLAAELMRAAEPVPVVLELTRAERSTELALLQGSWRSRCDALVLVPRGTDPAARAYEDADDAVVLIADDGPAGLTRITCPPRAQGDLVARHLSGLGRRRAAVLGITDPADRWTEACEASLRRAGLEVPPQAVIRLAEPDGVRGGVEAVARLLHQGSDVEAVVCHNDAIASGVLSTLLRRGARVPEDVVVIGRGDTETAAFATPSLTSVSCAAAATAAAATAHFRARLTDPLPRPRTIEVAPALTVRRSSSSTSSESSGGSGTSGPSRASEPSGT